MRNKAREREREGKKMKNFAAETSLRAQLPERGHLCALSPLPAAFPCPSSISTAAAAAAC